MTGLDLEVVMSHLPQSFAQASMVLVCQCKCFGACVIQNASV